LLRGLLAASQGFGLQVMEENQHIIRNYIAAYPDTIILMLTRTPTLSGRWISLTSTWSIRTAVVPGTKMGYPGQKDDQKRADIIAYLATLKLTSGPGGPAGPKRGSAAKD
jgi:hypothetical protein